MEAHAKEIPLSRQMSVPTKSIAASGIIGLAVPTISGALVPAAMSTFGVVTNGGTIHVAGGIAATLQYISTCGLTAGSILTVPTAVIGLLYYNKDVIRDGIRAKIQAKL